MEQGKLRKLQNIQVEITLAFDAFCKQHQLEYFIIGGTLLGAVRHKGFIPWDDDIDVGMTREHYDKFIKLYLQNPIDGLFLHTTENDAQYYLPFVKLKKDGTEYIDEDTKNVDTHKGIFLDIFPFDDVKDPDSFVCRQQAKLVNQLTYTLSKKRGTKVYPSKSKFQKIFDFVFSFYNIKGLVKLQKKIMTFNNNKGYNYFINFSSPYYYKKELFPKEKYYPIKKYEFEDTQFEGPADYDYVLSHVFGDYMQLPPEDKRMTHAIDVKFND
ncbi:MULTISPECIES: LicD family protein [Flammeovirga]|uniref:LicD family protein n=1 Tax=Flammeovirga agarivorans TaxID=2726742 RepID=A0A7X8XWX6_9BACT|nr:MULTISPECIES: LicD family protein [Flammeovirga]NLR92659.1 LicD family protein [Flammeovirga agarivorans]